MPQYQAEVIETRAFLCRYRVEAEDREQALAQLNCGDTLDEIDVKEYGVLHRDVQSETVLHSN